MSERQAVRVASAEAFAKQATAENRVSSGKVARQGDVPRRLSRIPGLREDGGVQVVRSTGWYLLWAPGLGALLGVAHYDIGNKRLTVYGPPWVPGRQPRPASEHFATRISRERWDRYLNALGVTREDGETPIPALGRWDATHRPVVWPEHDDERCHVEPCRTCATDRPESVYASTPQETP